MMKIAGVGKRPKEKAALESIPAPTPWPNANARLLGLGTGLYYEPLNRLADFSAEQFERFTLEWADDYLRTAIASIDEVQQRGGSGDKGRDIVVWLDPPGVTPRRWRLYQCKHYEDKLGTDSAATEIGKVLYYTAIGDYEPPEEYWFVTHKGVTGPLQDLLDAPDKLRAFILEKWADYCEKKIIKGSVPLTEKLREHIASFDFSIFRAKQPQDLITEHSKTKYHLTVFGLPLLERAPPPLPPSAVAPTESRYVQQLFAVISERLGIPIGSSNDFNGQMKMVDLFNRSRLTFYCAEGLKELARDQMADSAFFDTLLDEFANGTYHAYMGDLQTGMERLTATVQAAQSLQLGGHILALHTTTNDREGICHQLVNNERINWCEE